jgi:O-acetyl-ADP-ribose deacetylase (regulator of RNase III)
VSPVGVGARVAPECAGSGIALAEERSFKRVALPIIGAGSGGFDEAEALALIEGTLRGIDSG